MMVEQLKQNKTISFTVIGQSMHPFFKDQETDVWLKKVAQYKKYDVVLFMYQQQILLHRIIKIKQGQYFLQGDGALRIEKVDKSHIYGKVIDFRTNGKMIRCYDLKVRLWVSIRLFRKYLLKIFK